MAKAGVIVLLILAALSVAALLAPSSPPHSSSPSCFPESSQVMTKRGAVKMGELSIGDWVLTASVDCPDCGHFFTKITGWLHRDAQIRNEYLQIIDANGESFDVSPLHSLATHQGTYVFAEDAPKHQLFASEANISKVYRKEMKGAYAPMTEAGNYFVLKTNGEKVLAHCIPNIANPAAFEPAVRLAIAVYEGLFTVGDRTTHPVVHWLRRFESLVGK